LEAQTGQRRRWSILAVLISAQMAITIDNTVLNVALKTLASPVSGLGASQGELEWAINAYTLVFASMLFTFGVLGDRFGRKRMLMIGLALFGLGSLCSAYSGSPGELIAARAAMGVGGGAVLPQSLSIIANVFEGKQRARAIGIWASAVGIGASVGPLLGGTLLASFWWGSVFLINVPVTIIGSVATLLLVPESRNPVTRKVDYLGVLASVVGLVLLVYGIVQGGDSGSWGRGNVLGPIAGGGVILALFAWYETRIAYPSLDVRLFRNHQLTACITAVALSFFSLGGVYFFTSFYTQDVRGYSPLDAGLLSAPFALSQLFVAPRSATLVTWFGLRAVSGGGALLSISAIAGYSLLGTSSPIWVLAVLFGIQGIGMGMATSATTAAIMAAVPRAQAGVGSALTNIARQVSSALGVAILGSVLAQSYRSAIAPTLAALPAVARGTASQSISSTQAVAQHLGPAGRFLIAHGDAAFVTAMHITTLSAVAIGVVGRLTVLRWLPDRPPAKHQHPKAGGRHRAGAPARVPEAATARSRAAA
jgi:MFS transporter, DHA2 family, multidrug resistance protein